MNVYKFLRCSAASLALLALLPACAGSQLPVGVSSAQSGSIGPRTSSGDLIYATGYTSPGTGKTFMLTYPQGQLVGTINQSASGMCSDTDGNVYLLYMNAAIEYAHGGTKPIRTLRIPGAQTYSCSVDPSSGNLAVTFSCPPCGYQNLAIFPSGSGTPTRYSAPAFFTCSYDGQGNLFLAGETASGLSELPRGSSTFINITLNQYLGDAGQVQWDGKYITLQTFGSPGPIYQIQVTGSSGTVVGETKFGRFMKREGYSWISISHGTILMPFSQHGSQTNQLGIWKYPRGGGAMKIIKTFGTGDHGFGSATLSVAPSSH